MPTKIERIKLEALLRETLGLASTGNDPVVINEPPVVPVQPKPSVSGAEVGKLKSVPAFETNPTMRKLGKLLSKLSDAIVPAMRWTDIRLLPGVLDVGLPYACFGWHRESAPSTAP